MALVTQQYDPAVALDSLSEHPRNPRRGSDADVARSIDVNGFYGAIIAQLGTRHVLAGHTRRRALIASGDTDAPVIWLDCDDDTALRVLLADNRTAEQAVWDDSVLADVLADLTASDAGIDGTGFGTDDLDKLLAEMADKYAEADAAEPDSEIGLEPVSEAPPIYPDAAIAASAHAYYRGIGFPYPHVLQHEAMQQINRLAAMPTATLRSSIAGYHIADSYHPARFSVRIDGDRPSPTVTFARDDRLMQAFEFALEHNWTLTDLSILNALSFVRGSQIAAQFRPGFALYLLRKHCAAEGAGARWLDTSAGWGGRLIGYAASGASEYVGIDPSTEALDGNRRMIDELSIAGTTLIPKPAEDVSVAEIGGAASFDVAITSPPYFSKERYSDEATQSYARWPEPEAWRAGFLQPMLALQYAALKPGAPNVLNVADVKLRGGADVPLVEWATHDAEAVGFALRLVEDLPIGRVPGSGERPERAETCLVFAKPEK